MGGSARRAGIRARRRLFLAYPDRGGSSTRRRSLCRCPLMSVSSTAPESVPQCGRRTREVFTGIVEELGEVTAVEKLGDSSRFRLRGPVVTQGARHGDSIAVNGVCLTVVEHEDDWFTADVMAESLERSSLGALTAGFPRQPRTPHGRRRPPRRTHRAGARRRHGPGHRAQAVRELGDRQDLAPGGPHAVRRREGLHHRRRHQPHRRRQQAPTTSPSASSRPPST